MKHVKLFLIYAVSFIFILFLTASFGSGKYMSDAYMVNLDSKIMYYAFAGNLKDYVEGKVDADADISVDTADRKYSRTYAEGDSGEEVQEYKYILYYLDYLSDEPNDHFNKETLRAVKSYQESHGLNESGLLDKTTMQSLDDEIIEYRQGKQSDDILRYSKILYYLGYLKKTPQKRFTADTKIAVENYQKKKSITVTGTMNVQTRRSLDGETPVYKKGHKGSEIKEYQKILIRTGDLKGSADGNFDDRTKKAVESYQKKNNLKVNGTIDADTQKKLDSEN